MKIAFACSEAWPLIKTGGLADVCGALPKALKGKRQDVRLIMPAYLKIKQQLPALRKAGCVSIKGLGLQADILEGQLPGTKVPLYLIDAPDYFERSGNPYSGPDGQDWQDNHLRFTIFNRAIAEIAQDRGGLQWRPDILHCHDWQTGLAPALLARDSSRPKVLFTIHNLAYMGLFSYEQFTQTGLPSELWHMESMEFYDQFAFIKGGLMHADAISTVSPTYAREICTPAFGYGLDPLLRFREDRLYGILNGIDYDEWNPQKDAHLDHHYHSQDFSGKAAIKASLQQEFGLEAQPDKPLLVHIGRMVEQKGVDLILKAAPDLISNLDCQLLILGSGDKRFEQQARELAQQYPGQISCRIGYDEALAHRMEAGGDIFLMPSRFEPCGLNQLYSLRYGTIPVVTPTGGLADSVVDCTPQSLSEQRANGYHLREASVFALLQACQRACADFANPSLWRQLQQNGMNTDHSWKHSAEEYLKLYRSL